MILHNYIHNAVLVLKKLYSQKYHANSYCVLDFFFKENEKRERGNVEELLRESGETKCSAVTFYLILYEIV